jgi:uncharacterized membrane protein YkvA (DUF1232 family)
MIFHILRLIIRLMADRRVSIWVKLIPVAAVAYILSPIDLRPDFIPVLGQVDDLLIAILLFSVFIMLAPSEARRDGLRPGNAARKDDPEAPATFEGRMRNVDDDAPPG